MAERSDRRRGEDGYNLVILVVAVTVLNIGIAAALPVWSHFTQREKEEELIFRGLQYAEAIRLYQAKHGALPTKLEDLIENEPRFIRQLYPNPMSEDGSWGLVLDGGGRPPNGSNPSTGNPLDRIRDRNRTRLNPQDDDAPGLRPDANGDLLATGADGEQVRGPIKGVYSSDGSDGIKTFFNSSSVTDWRFTYDLFQDAQIGGDPNPNRPNPLNASTLGRPFPPGIQVQTMTPVVGGDVRNVPGAPTSGIGSPDQGGGGGADGRPGGG